MTNQGGAGAAAPASGSYYAAHRKIYPREVNGRFQRLRWIALWLLLGLYYLLPWIDLHGRQSVLFDLRARQFYVFDLVLWPQDFIFLTWLLVIAALSLFFFTALAGRIWCGYACPQTVWTDLFILVERWIEGDRNARVRLWNQKWDFRKARLRIIKWTVWLLIGLATGGGDFVETVAEGF